MNILEVMRQALDALENYAHGIGEEGELVVAGDLRTAIAEMERQEPVAWGYWMWDGMKNVCVPAHPPKDKINHDPKTFPLYTYLPIPEGWQLVPVEPNEEMCRALWRRDRLDTCGIIWERVLQAAPKPEDV